MDALFPHEHAYFQQIEGIIADKLEQLQNHKEELRSQVISARSEMWSDTTHLIRDFDDVVMLSMQDQQVAASETQYHENEAEIRRLLKMQQSPYFGRLDFTEEDDETCTIYIGIHSLKRDDSYDFYIVDWRAPVSSLYYNFDLGDAWYEALGTRYHVNITLKRQFQIENGQLLLVYDTNSAMFDEILGNMLSQNTNHNLKVIISSIQKEQNIAIRCNTHQSCLIYGLAGSGKTSVGLHRLAYLLYHNRNTIKAEQILIISNNQIFSSYISTILPDLGEEPAKTAIFHDLLLTHLERNIQIEDYYAQLKHMEAHPNSDRVQWIRLKYSLEFLDFCAAHLASYDFQIPEVKYQGTVVVSPEIYRSRWGTRSVFKIKTGYDTLLERVRECIENYFHEHESAIKRSIEDHSNDFLSEKAVDFLYQNALQKTISTATEQIISLNHLDPGYQLVDLLRAYLHKIGANGQEATRLERTLRQEKLLYEDALLYLFVKIQMGLITPSQKIRHIVIDEVQDYNPLQLTILKLLFPKSTFTLLGDIYQTINSITTTQAYDTFTRVFGQDLLRIRLNKCYRSSSDINALAFRLLDHESSPVSAEYTYFDRPFKKPQYLICTDPLSCLVPLLEQLAHYNAVAIITNTEKEALRVHTSLSPALDAQLIIDPSAQLDRKLVILPLLLAKGLEFDAVILINSVSSNQEKTDFRRKVYLGCTRALHELYLLETTPLPQSMAECAPYLEIHRLDEAQSPAD